MSHRVSEEWLSDSALDEQDKDVALTYHIIKEGLQLSCVYGVGSREVFVASLIRFMCPQSLET